MILLMLLKLFGNCVEDCKETTANREECINNCLKALNTKKIEEIVKDLDLDELEEQLSILKDLQKIINKTLQEIEQEIEVKKEELEIGI